MIDKEKIDAIMAIEDQREAKTKLADYAQEEFGIKLLRNKTLANMLKDLEEQAPADQDQRGHAPTPDQLAELLVDSPVDQVISVVTEEPTPEIVLPEKEIVDDIYSQLSDNFRSDDLPAPVVVEEAVIVPDGKPEWIDNFNPHINMMGRKAGNNGYYTCPYWIYDWIQKTDKWYVRFNECPQYSARQTLQALAYYLHLDGSVLIRESRNSRFIKLEK